MRNLLFGLSLSLLSLTPAHAQVSVGFNVPGVSIGINFSDYPELVRVPGYPVYYSPRASSNYFFYDGLYWVYWDDNWYASDWYNGPWQEVGPEDVPFFLLRVPVRYYRRPPIYFRGWRTSSAPHWGEHWGRDWEQRRGGWDRWDRRSAPAPAPLPVYQRQYSGDRYPRAVEQQRSIQTQNYRYQPREAVTQRIEAPSATRQQTAPPPQERRRETSAPPRERYQQPAPPPQDRRRDTAAPPQERHQQPAPPPQDRRREASAPPQERHQQPPPPPQGRGQEQRAAPQDKGRENKPPKQNKGQEKKEERRQDGQ